MRRSNEFESMAASVRLLRAFLICARVLIGKLAARTSVIAGGYGPATRLESRATVSVGGTIGDGSSQGVRVTIRPWLQRGTRLSAVGVDHVSH